MSDGSRYVVTLVVAGFSTKEDAESYIPYLGTAFENIPESLPYVAVADAVREDVFARMVMARMRAERNGSRT